MTNTGIPLSISNKPNYRLGDLILQKARRNLACSNGDAWNTFPNQKDCSTETLADLTIQNWPDSLASRYLRETDAEGDIEVLSKLVDASNHTSSHPHPNDAVLHLRVGDVIDNVPGRTALDFWARPTSIYEGEPYRLFYPNWSYFVLCETQILEILEKLKHYRISSVKLVYGVHIEGEFPQSKEYIRLCTELLKIKGFCVELVSHADADEAFVYMCNANTFFSTGGGFGQLVGDIVEHRGGLFIRRAKSALPYAPTYLSVIVGILIILILGWFIWQHRCTSIIPPRRARRATDARRARPAP